MAPLNDIIVKAKLFSLVCQFFVLVGLFIIAPTSQAQIAAWNYEPLQGTMANPTANVGSGSSAVLNPNPVTEIITTGTATGMDATINSGCGTQNGVTAWALNPFNPGTTNESNGVQFNASTSGYQNIIFTWDQRWSNTSANTLRVQYTTNGATWINFIMTNPGNTTFCNGALNGNGCFETNATGDEYRRIRVDFSAITAVNNNPNFGVRILASYYQATTEFRQTSFPGLAANPAGTWRFDNVAFTGTLQPGPTASAITGTVSICNGFSANLAVTITGGTGPFTLVYTDGTANYTINNYASGNNINVSPAVTTNYSIISVANANSVLGVNNTGSARVTIKTPPTVSVSSTSTCSTGSVSLTPLVTVSPAGGTGFFSIANPYSGATANFTYTYTFNGCTTVSNVAAFTRNTAPVVTIQPSGTQTVCQGSALSPIIIAASGAMSYQWYYNSIPSFSGAATIALSNTTAYTPPSATAYGPRYFTFRAINGCGSTNSTVWAGPFYVTATSVAGIVSGGQTICVNTVPTSDLTLAGQTGTVIKWQKADDNGFTVNVADIASTSTTLAAATIGALSQTTYFRAFVQNGGCAITSTLPIQILIKATTWSGSWSAGLPDSVTTAIFNADYVSTGNISACAVKVTGGNVIFNSGDVLTIQNGLDISGGAMTFENNASLVQVNNTVNNGVITYKRNTTAVRKFDYTYWSSPVNNQILANLSPLTLSDKYFWFNTTTYTWNNVATPGITVMDLGKGFIIRAPQNFDPVIPAVYNGTFSGIPNNGDYPVNIVYTDATHDLNCIGNPYPSALSADAFILGNPGTFGAGTTLYFWTHNTPITNNAYTFSDYATYNFSGGVGTGIPASGTNSATPVGNIAAGQGFMVKGKTTGTATFKNTMRLGANNNEFYRANQFEATALTDTEKNRLWLDLTNEAGAFKQLLVGYIQNATDGFDSGYDGEALEAGNSVSFYSILDTTKLTIQGKALPFNSNDAVALGYRTTIEGNYQIALSQTDGVFADQSVFLEDQLLHTMHDLKVSRYEFTTPSGTNDSRFVLRFNQANLAVSNTKLNPDTVLVYNDGNEILVHSSNTNLKHIEIFDISGRLLFKKDVANTRAASCSRLSAPTVVMVKVTLENGMVLTKKIVN